MPLLHNFFIKKYFIRKKKKYCWGGYRKTKHLVLFKKKKLQPEGGEWLDG